MFLRELIAQLGSSRPCLAFEADGRFEGSLGVASVEELASSYVKLLRDRQPSGPYFLCGYSAGGLIAFEMARQLGSDVGFLGLVDTYAPVTGRRVSSFQKKLNHVRALRSLETRERFAFAARTLSRVVRRERKRVGGPDVDGPLRRALLDLIQAYEPPKGYEGRIDVFRPSVPFLSARLDRSLGWDRLGVGRLRVHDVPGDHRTVFEGENAKELARAMSSVLDVAEPSHE